MNSGRVSTRRRTPRISRKAAGEPMGHWCAALRNACCSACAAHSRGHSPSSTFYLLHVQGQRAHADALVVEEGSDNTTRKLSISGPQGAKSQG